MDEAKDAQITGTLTEEAGLTADERVFLRCRLAKDLEDKGEYEAAAELLEPYFQLDQHADLSGLNDAAGAELLLRCGTLTGWLGNLKQIEGAQEAAKDLVGESLSKFERLKLLNKQAEAQIELAYCYWREGGFDEARVLLQQAIDRLEINGGELKLVALLRKALVESSATRFNDSLNILLNAAPLFDTSTNHTLKGRFHNELAYSFQSLGNSENRADYVDRALVEFTAAAYHFEHAGHTRYRAHVENNVGLLFYTLGKYDEAHEHLDRAGSLYPALKNAVYSATVDETRARVFVAQSQFSKAVEAAQSACEIFEQAGELAQLAEARTTLGKALARQDRKVEAREILERAVTIGEEAGSVENAGLALLTLMEEVAPLLTSDDLRSCYQRADELLSRSQHPETLARLRLAARKAVEGNAGGFNDKPGSAAPQAQSGPLVHGLLVESQRRHHKEITFTSDALEAIEQFFFNDEVNTLSTLIDETIRVAAAGSLITAEAVEVVALRGQPPRGNFAQPWDDFSLKGELREPERRFIELALKAAEGRISIAARLLGFNHNELLTSIIKSRYPDLLAARTPAVRRKRSIIRKPQPRSKR